MIASVRTPRSARGPGSRPSPRPSRSVRASPLSGAASTLVQPFPDIDVDRMPSSSLARVSLMTSTVREHSPQGMLTLNGPPPARPAVQGQPHGLRRHRVPPGRLPGRESKHAWRKTSIGPELEACRAAEHQAISCGSTSTDHRTLRADGRASRAAIHSGRKRWHHGSRFGVHEELRAITPARRSIGAGAGPSTVTPGRGRAFARRSASARNARGASGCGASARTSARLAYGGRAGAAGARRGRPRRTSGSRRAPGCAAADGSDGGSGAAPGRGRSPRPARPAT